MKRNVCLIALLLTLTLPAPGQKIEFDEPFDIRERLDIPGGVDFRVASNGLNVYVLSAFQDQDTHEWVVSLAYSIDGGISFEERVLYRWGIIALQPQIALSNDTVHVAFFVGGSHSQGNYCHIPSDEDLPCQRGRFFSGFNQPDNLRLAAGGNNVYLAWNKSAFEGNVYLMYSTDGGETFSFPINLTNDVERQARQLTDLRATGNNVYLRWDLLTFNPQRRQPFLMHGAIVK